MASYLYRTAQPPILAAFLPWGGSAGAGRIRLAGAKVHAFYQIIKFFEERFVILGTVDHFDKLNDQNPGC